MEFPRRRFLQLAAGAAALPAISQSASAQAYPSKPITLIVPYAAGGPTDSIARVLAERMRSSLGQTIVVENTTGAGGTIAVGRLVRSTPDGYTIGIGQNGSHVVTGATYAGRLSYDLLNDMDPLSLITDAPFFLAGKKTFPADDLKGLIAWMKANPGKAVFGNGGNGSISHICGLLFMDLTKTSAQVVPYRGNAPAMQDLVAGQIDIMVADPVTGVPQVHGGNIKAYGVTAKNRLTTAPNIPTVDEAGLPGYHVSLWHGLWLPKGVPAPISAKLNAVVVEALADPAVRAKLGGLGQDIYPAERQNPKALDAHQRSEIAKWWPLIKEAGIKVE